MTPHGNKKPRGPVSNDAHQPTAISLLKGGGVLKACVIPSSGLGYPRLTAFGPSRAQARRPQDRRPRSQARRPEADQRRGDGVTLWLGDSAWRARRRGVHERRRRRCCAWEQYGHDRPWKGGPAVEAVLRIEGAAEEDVDRLGPTGQELGTKEERGGIFSGGPCCVCVLSLSCCFAVLFAHLWAMYYWPAWCRPSFE